LATFREILSKLFTRNVVIKRLPGDRLKAYDVSKTQLMGPATPTYSRARWRRNSATGGYGYGYINADMEALRKKMYVDYELMDSDALIASVLDIYADESTTASENGELLIIKSEDEKIKKILHNLFYDILNIEFNLWSWIRTTCKYGDYFLYLDIREEYGVVNVTPIHPSLVAREEGDHNDPSVVRFVYEGDNSMFANSGKLEAFEVAHFRLLTDPNYLPYGRSVVEPGRRVYKSLQLMEDAMLIHRIMRAPERRIFKIDVGNISPEEVDAYIEEIANGMKKTPYMDEQTGEFNLRFNLSNMMEDYFLPVRGGQSGTTIDTLPGLSSEGKIEDVEYLKNKLLAALKVPKAYLQGEDSGQSAKAGLSTLDIRFSRTIERVQKVFVSELYKIAIVHLYVQGYKHEDLQNFELYLTSPSIIYERQKIELMASKFELFQTNNEQKIFSDKYLYENIFGLTSDEWQDDRDQKIEDLKFKFRMKQIEEEGNDPAVTGKTFGTPHDIASLQMASRRGIDSGDDIKKLIAHDERENNEGRPKSTTDFGTDRDKAFGRDPVGKKTMEKMAGLEAFVRQLTSKTDFRTILKENEIKKIQMLDEQNLFDDWDFMENKT
jgi:hypothetical protein